MNYLFFLLFDLFLCSPMCTCFIFPAKPKYFFKYSSFIGLSKWLTCIVRPSGSSRSEDSDDGAYALQQQKIVTSLERGTLRILYSDIITALLFNKRNMLQRRITYRRRSAYRTQSNRLKQIKTPGTFASPYRFFRWKARCSSHCQEIQGS